MEGVFCDRLKSDSTAALDCLTDQNKGRYCRKELLLLLVSLVLDYTKLSKLKEPEKYKSLDKNSMKTRSKPCHAC